MAKRSKSKKKVYQTGPVTLEFPHINREDPRYGGYKTNFKMPVQDSAEARDSIKAEMVRKLGAEDAKECKKPYWVDKKDENIVVFRARSSYQPKVYDIKGRLIPASRLPAIYGGTLAKITYEVMARPEDDDNDASCVLYLKSIQLLKVSTYTPFQDASAEVEGEGFVWDGGANEDTEDEFQDDGLTDDDDNVEDEDFDDGGLAEDTDDDDEDF